MPDLSPLAAEIAQNAAAVRERIAAAARRSGRDADAVTLIAVTKTHPVETVRAAIEAGLRDLGENRVQELVEKSEGIPGEVQGGDVRWHLIGSLQRNKARDAAARADLVHAVDSERLADALDRKAGEAGRVLPVLVQVNISGEEAKHGVSPDAAHDLLAAIVDCPHLRAIGVMGMAEAAEDAGGLEAYVRPSFRRLRTLFDTYTGPGREGLTAVSMGMSGDFEVAVEEGATHVRVGSALFGARPPLP